METENERYVRQVILAGQQNDWHGVMGLTPFTSDPASLKRNYLRLVILVHPDKNLKMVQEACIAFDFVKRAHNALMEELNPPPPSPEQRKRGRSASSSTRKAPKRSKTTAPKSSKASSSKQRSRSRSRKPRKKAEKPTTPRGAELDEEEEERFEWSHCPFCGRRGQHFVDNTEFLMECSYCGNMWKGTP